MKKYQVTVEAIVRKTYTVEADTEDDAMEQAHEMFSVLNEPNVDEHYDQRLVDIEEVTK